MPDISKTGTYVGKHVIASFTGTVNINSGSAIAAGVSITDTYTFTGAATTDTMFGLAARDATVIPYGLKLSSLTISAANTVTAVWTNTTNASITPPASATWTLAIFGLFMK